MTLLVPFMLRFGFRSIREPWCITVSRTDWKKATVSPVCHQPRCQQRSFQTRWARRPLGTGPCWRQSADRSSHKLHLQQSPTSYGWLPSLQEYQGRTRKAWRKLIAAFDYVQFPWFTPVNHVTEVGHLKLCITVYALWNEVKHKEYVLSVAGHRCITILNIVYHVQERKWFSIWD